ncbi:hypothetical protein RND71_028046 [Anisodus tanguticus]|uniref:Uncharacterized protein n=1 Tax=Anisodus tanguticus TaxID=243964 RepID=A0AAE1RJ04_9SOLA|nr:hypothetical protein RND71_028046 [Anisodus tanguticus]
MLKGRLKCSLLRYLSFFLPKNLINGILLLRNYSRNPCSFTFLVRYIWLFGLKIWNLHREVLM